MDRIFVLNGVNLRSLIERRPEVYGEKTLKDFERLLRGEFPWVEFDFRQTDHEGELIAWIHEAADSEGPSYRAAADYILSVGQSER